jgi:catabolite regulation protein CreA
MNIDKQLSMGYIINKYGMEFLKKEVFLLLKQLDIRRRYDTKRF